MSVGRPPTITLSPVLIMRFQDDLGFLAIWVVLESLRGKNLQLEWVGKFIFFRGSAVHLISGQPCNLQARGHQDSKNNTGLILFLKVRLTPTPILLLKMANSCQKW